MRGEERIVWMIWPDITGPGLNNIVEKCPERAGTNADSEAAETEHEYEGSEDVDPEVDDDNHREDVDSSVTVGAVSPSHPDCACHKPANLEEDVDWNWEE